jgi:hypothetical protein
MGNHVTDVCLLAVDGQLPVLGYSFHFFLEDQYLFFPSCCISKAIFLRFTSISLLLPITVAARAKT